MTDHLSIDKTKLERDVLKERIRQFMMGERINGYSGPFAASLILIYLLHGYVDNLRLMTWWLLLLGADGPSIVLTTIYLRSSNIKRHEIWMNVQIFFQALAGFVWGLSVYLFWIENSEVTQFYNYIVLVAVSGVPAVSLLPVYKAYFAYTLSLHK